jgi:hypothetical protein
MNPHPGASISLWSLPTFSFNLRVGLPLHVFSRKIWKHFLSDTRQCRWLKRYATSRDVSGSSLSEVTEFFNLPNPSAILWPSNLLTLWQIWEPEDISEDKARPAFKADSLALHLWADCLDNVGSSTSHITIGLHGVFRRYV